jgi:DNA gyrase/topoisomerase IV subunit A
MAQYKIEELSIFDLIETQYKTYSRYVLEFRAIPSVIDGLKPVHRRAMWIAKGLAKDNYIKVSKLAGAAMSIHPHGNTSIEDAITGMAQPFAGANNIIWFEGKGAFGSRITGPGKGIGAARYVSVKLSDNFFKIMDVDSDIIEKCPNYDETEQEPVNFLPIVPSILLNPTHGIAVGFACTILPRKLSDILECQKLHLKGKDFKAPPVHYDGYTGKITHVEGDIWKSEGVFERLGKKKIVITEVPIGVNREGFVNLLDSLEDKDIITSYTDDCTDIFKFSINLKNEMTDDAIINVFKLTSLHHENINVIDFNGKIRKMTVKEIIKEFTDYRFGLYINRYKKMGRDAKKIYSFKLDLLKVIKKQLFKKFPQHTKKEIESLLLENGINEINITKIIQVPIYRFGKDEIEKLEKDVAELKEKLTHLIALCKDEMLRKKEYYKELKSIS